MQQESPTNYVLAFVVLLFAGANGAAATYAKFATGGGADLAMLTLAVLCLPSTAFVGARLVPITRAMRGNGTPFDRHFATANLVSMLCGSLGSIIVAILVGTPGATLDATNDVAVYFAFALLVLAIALTTIGATIGDLRRLREKE